MKRIFLPLFLLVLLAGTVLTALHKNSSDITPLDKL